MNNTDDAGAVDCASPPCFMHEVEASYMGFSVTVDARQQADVKRWRDGERERLIRERLALAAGIRRDASERIAERLETEIGACPGLTVSGYWPFRGEPDLRPFMTMLARRGARIALPVVVARSRPLVFRAWGPGEPLARGVWNIPVPDENADVVVPDVVIAPVVGFDAACYRLGYGGGFFDRTLAAVANKPRVIGVGLARAAIATIYPQPHDVPMDMVVTEDAAIWPPGQR